MARTARHSREQMLQAAMGVFWRSGYEGATVETLQRAMALHRGSLYFHFGDKDSLFREVLLHYRTAVVAPRRALVENAATGRAGVEVFFRDLLEAPTRRGTPPGCLNTNAATEVGPINPETARFLREGMRIWEEFWAAAVARGQADGSIASRRPPRAIAKQLVLLTQGLNVLGRIGTPRADLLAAMRAGLACLE